MIASERSMTHACSSSTLADVLERVLDKGVVIAGDIKIKLVDIELLTIQIRLMIASVDKAKEMGMDWWMTNPQFTSQAVPENPPPRGRTEATRCEPAGRNGPGPYRLMTNIP